MIKLNKIGIIVFVLATWQVRAQSYFNNLYENSFGFSHVISNQLDYTCTGAVYNPSGSGSVTLSKYDLMGQTTFIDTFSDDGIVTVGAYILVNNNDFYLTNTINDTPPYLSSTWDIQLSKFNDSFNQIWTQYLGGNQTDQPFEIVEKDSFLYIIGTTNSFGAGNGDYYVIKTDLSGNIIWEHTYGTSTNELLWGALKTDDGNLILTGVKKITVDDYNINYVKIDTSGQVIWEREYNYGINDQCGYGITLYDHNFLTYHNLNDGNGGTTIGYVKKLDGKGDLLWNKAFPYNTLSSFNNLSKPIENPDGSIIVSNTCKNTDGIMINRMIKLDPFGNTLWEKEYYTRPDLPQYIYDIKPTNDGGYIMCGSAFPIDTNIQHAWLVKTNCNGEDGVQHPITGAFCEQYDCSLYPIDATFTTSSITVDLAFGGTVNFENNSSNTTSSVWNFGDGEMDYTDSLMSHTFTQVGTYEVQLIVFHGMCSDTMTQSIEVINSAGIFSPNLDYGLSVFPNPSTGDFTLSFKYAPEGYFEIVDLAGRIHYTEKLNGALDYSINDLMSGAYLLNIHYPSGVSEIKKLIVE